MNKAQLYEECKRLREHNMRLHLFQDDNLIKKNRELSRKIDNLKWSEGVHITQRDKIIEQLKKENEVLNEENKKLECYGETEGETEDYIEKLEKENEKLLNDVSCLEDLLKNKKEEEKDTLSAEEEMNMVEVLSEELGEKEQKIMNLEKEFEEQKKVLEKAEDSIEMAVFRDLVYQCPQCEYLTENRCKRYADPKYPDQDVFRCWECRNDDTTSEEEEEEEPFQAGAIHINEDGTVLGEIQEDGTVIVLSEEEEEQS
tara:strand:+ start:261 stop:1031 length:771 start_codon:yes stop_codon:yes gene_type:complete